MSWFKKPKVKVDNQQLLQTLSETKGDFNKRLDYIQKDVDNTKREAIALGKQNRREGLVYLLHVMFIIIF
jgi:tetrahydromethanopterin S-methyltransferase subunit G